MRNRILLGAAVTAVAGLAALPVVSGAAGPSSAKLSITSSSSYKINRYIQQGLRFSKDVVTIGSGGTVTVASKTPDEPHTLSIVTESQLPKTKSKIDNCFPNGICGKVGKAHKFPAGDGPAKKPLVDVGAKGFDTAGDSIVINPGKTVKFKVTAPAGTRLAFFCAFHPWMQAHFAVK
jgi:hypothetical protein